MKMLRNKSKSINNQEIIVFGNDFWNTYGIIRALGEAGLRTVFINVCQGKSFVKHSRYIKRYWQVKNEDEAYKTLISNYGKGKSRDIVLCSCDELVGLLDANLDSLKDSFITFNCKGQQGEINKLMSKDKMLEVARKVGLTVPQCISVDLFHQSVEDVIEQEKIKYPCLTKAESSLIGTKENLCKCANKDELKIALEHSIALGCHKLQIQEYIDKEYEMMITGCADGKGNVIIPGIIKKLTEYPMGFATKAAVEKEVENYIEPQTVKDFILETGFSGVFSMEFLLSEDKLYFMEINLRNDGNGYATIPGGVNIHKIWVDSMIGKQMLQAKQRIDRDYVYQVEPTALNYHCFEGNGYWSFIKEFLKVDFRLICNLKDPMPGLYRFCLNKFI